MSAAARSPRNTLRSSLLGLAEKLFHPALANPLGWLCLIVSLLVTMAGSYFSYDEIVRSAHVRFALGTKEIESAIHERMLDYKNVLRGGVALFAASEYVSREEWRTYVKTMDAERYYPGIQGIGFARLISPADKEAHLIEVRAEGFPDYVIRPDGERDEYTSIIYLEPFNWRNRRAFGYDMFSEPVRHEAMVRARDTGQATLSGKVALVQETEKDVPAGCLMFLPVYRNGAPVTTVSDRRAALLGYVYSPFRMDDLLRGIVQHGDIEIEFQIFDGDNITIESLMYHSGSSATPIPDRKRSPFAVRQISLEMNGRQWSVHFSTLPPFEKDIGMARPFLILVLGSMISVLLLAVIRSSSASRAYAATLAITAKHLENANRDLQEEVAEHKRAEENMLKEKHFSDAALDSLPGIFYLLDNQGRFMRWNKNLEDVSGYSAEEITRMHPLDFFVGEDQNS